MRAKLASYKTEKGAQKYADEIMKKYPNIKAVPVVNRNFRYWVKVMLKNGQIAMAERRPVRFEQQLGQSFHVSLPL